MKKKIIFAAIFLFMMLCQEQAVRFCLFGMDSFNFVRMNSLHYALDFAGLVRPSAYPRIIYELRPNLNVYFKMAPLITNSQGLSDNEYAIKKSPNSFRVAVMGASYTMPAGVKIEDAFHTLVENRLNTESPYISYEFINFAVGGYTPWQSLAVLEHKAFQYHPDLILFDVDRPDFIIRNREDDPVALVEFKKARNPFLESFTLKLIQKIVRGKRRWNNSNLTEIENWVALNRLFEALSKLKEEYKVPICVNFNNLDTNAVDGKILGLAAQYGLYVVDMYPVSKKDGIARRTLNALDRHPTAEVHRVMADVLYDYLQEQHLLGQ